MHSNTEFAEEYTTAERIRIVVIMGFIGTIVVFLSKTLLFPWIQEFAVSAPCRKLFGINGFTFLWYGLFVGIPLHAAILAGAIFGWRGYKILRDGRFPPAKEKVFRPTKIRRGAEAKRIAYLHFAAILPFLALTLWGSFQAQKISGSMVGTIPCKTSSLYRA